MHHRVIILQYVHAFAAQCASAILDFLVLTDMHPLSIRNVNGVIDLNEFDYSLTKRCDPGPEYLSPAVSSIVDTAGSFTGVQEV